MKFPTVEAQADESFNAIHARRGLGAFSTLAPCNPDMYEDPKVLSAFLPPRIRENHPQIFGLEL